MTGEHGYFERLHKEHEHFVFAQLRQMGARGDATVKDLAQIVWMTVGLRLDTYNKQSEFRTWLYAITRNVVRNHCRTQKRRPLEFLPDPDIYPAANMFEAQVDMKRGLGSLSDGLRTTYVLHEFYGHKHEEIAAIMGTSEKASERRVTDAKAALGEYGNKHFQAAAVLFGLSTDMAMKRLHVFWGPQGVPGVPRWTWKSAVGVSGTAVGAVGAVAAVVALLLGSPVRSPTPVTVVAEVVAPSAPREDVPAVPTVTVAVSSALTVATSKPIVRRAPPPPPGPSLDDSRVLLLRVRKALNQGQFALAQQLLDEHHARFGTFDASARNGYQAEARR